MENYGVNFAITQFKSHIANAILNNQEKLNKDKDAYISAEELPAVLKNFGTNDVTKLLKRDNEKFKGSIFSQDQNNKKLINIMALKDENASAILNNQEKLNPDNDSYLNEEEVKEVLKYFGAKDVSSLLKDDSELSEQKENEVKDEDNNEPSSVSKPSDNNQTEEEQINETEQVEKSSTEKTDEEETVPVQEEQDVLTIYGTAANSLDNAINADLSLSTVGTPYAQTMETLEKLKNKREQDSKNTFDIDFKMDQLNSLVQDNIQGDTENNVATVTQKNTISYGKNGEKKAITNQSFSLNTNNAIKRKNEAESDEKNENTENNDEAADGSNKTKTDVDLSYKIDFRTLKPMEQGNVRVRGAISAGSDNCDIHVVGLYSKQLKNGGIINFSGNISETIEKDDNIGNYGFSFDYAKDKLSTGVMGYYSHSVTDGEKDSTFIAEAHGKYGNIARGAVGVQSSEGLKYYYSKATASGKKTFPNSNLSLSGHVEAEYGLINMDGLANTCQNLTVKANGSLAFTSKDLNANVYGNLAYRRMSYRYEGENSNNIVNAFTASVTGKVDTKNVGISTTFTALKGPSYNGMNDEGQMVKMHSSTTLSGSVQLALKGALLGLGDKVTPVINYNVCNEDGIKQNVGVGVILKP